MKLKIEISNDSKLNGFAGFLKDSAKEGTAKIKLNLETCFLAAADGEMSVEDFYYFLSENTVHELLHAFQEIYKRKFDEKEIEDALMQASKYLEKEK